MWDFRNHRTLQVFYRNHNCCVMPSVYIVESSSSVRNLIATFETHCLLPSSSLICTPAMKFMCACALVVQRTGFANRKNWTIIFSPFMNVVSFHFVEQRVKSAVFKTHDHTLIVHLYNMSFDIFLS